jgi:predicted  nucleic acid-binding Zn-ribbon protein
LLASLYPAWQQYEIYGLSQENGQLQSHLDELRQKSRRLEKKYTSVKKEIKHYAKAQNEARQKFSRLRKIADTLLSLKSTDEQYTSMLLTINTLLHKYGLTVNKVTQSGEKSLDLEIYSKQNKRDTIALFMKDLLAQGFSKVSSNEIIRNDDDYKSIVTVKR